MKAICFLLSSIVSVGVLLNSVSSYFNLTFPDLAVVFNPLNTDARINQLTQELNTKNSEIDLESLSRYSLRTIHWASGDARGYSILGEIKERQGKKQQALALFNHALSISDIEIYALLKKLEQASEQQNADSAIKFAKLIMIRWPAYFDQIAPVFVPLLLSPDGMNKVAKEFSDDDRNRSNLFFYLRQSPEGRGLAGDLVLLLNRNNAPGISVELTRTMTALFNSGDVDRAYRLFLFSLTPAERANTGYVFNASFDIKPAKQPFDWTIRTQSGVDFSRHSADVTQSKQGSTHDGLTVRFLDSPIRFKNISQILKLHDGKYTLSFAVGAEGLVNPKPLFLVVF